MVRIGQLAIVCLLLVGCRISFDPKIEVSLSPNVEAAQGSVLSLAFSPDGEHLASAYGFAYQTNHRVSRAGPPAAFVKVWSVNPFRIQDIAKFQVESSSYQHVQFSPDGETVVIQSDLKQSRWNVRRQALQTLPFEQISVASPDSKWVAGRIENEEGLTVWDASTQKVRIQLKIASDPIPLLFSPDASLLLVVNRQPEQMEVWNLMTGKKQATLDIFSWQKSCWEFSKDGRQVIGLVDESADQPVRIWDTTTGERRDLTGPVPGRVRCLALSPDGQTLVTGSEALGEKMEAELTFWDVASGTKIKSIVDDSSWGITAVAFQPDGKEIAVGNAAGKIQLRDVPSPDTSEND